MNSIIKWITTIFLEKIFKSIIEKVGDYFKQKEIEKKIKEERERKDRVSKENKRRLDLAIEKGNLDEIKQASENYINFIESNNNN